MQGRIRDEGRDTIEIGITGVVLTCPNHHSWEVPVSVVLEDMDAAKRCRLCGLLAEDMDAAGITRAVVKRGVVVDLFADGDA